MLADKPLLVLVLGMPSFLRGSFALFITREKK